MLHTIIKENTYQDSVALMRLSADLDTLDGVDKVSIMMGTPANKDILRETGFGTDDLGQGGPNDMVIVVGTDASDVVDTVVAEVDAFLAQAAQASASSTMATVRSLDRAREVLPDANLALISLPGEHVAEEGRRLLDAGMHLFIFSDNVSVDDEVQLKTLARERGLMVMGPDCGTGVIGGVPLAFANVAQPGFIGIVAASGTGTQEVMAAIDQHDAGISHAIGLGGRDLKEAVGGITALQAMDALDADETTAVIVLVSKPPAAGVRDAVLAKAQQLSKPVVAVLLGEQPDCLVEGNVVWATSLEEAGRIAAELVGASPVSLASGQRCIKGLYSGGTLASEAAIMIRRALGLAGSDTEEGYLLRADGHEIVDLGDDVYTRGRPHPMIDPSLRVAKVREELEDPATAVLLLDVVLGHGSMDDPAGALAPAITEGLAAARQAGREVAVIASVCGTSHDPQDYREQVATLQQAGVTVLANNAAAVRHALLVVLSAGRPAVPTSVGDHIAQLLAAPPNVLNVGLRQFAEVIDHHGTPVVHWDWRPRAGGDPELLALLDALA